MRLNKLLLLLFTVALVAAGLTSFIYVHRVVQDALTVDAHVEIGDYVGFNLDTDKLYFGTVFPGGSAERAIQISHHLKEPSLVTIRIDGPIATWIEPEYYSFFLYNQTKDIMFRIYPPRDAAFGNHTSTIRFFFKAI
ncbi:hypothetical protein JXA85_01660 [Candidatus Woesearchaeota archaeon]|nr:hypothetical protein [Candidatus Woesearchaeota archaeon]